MGTKGSVKEKTKIHVAEPKQYKVIMHNDDFTTMEFVVEILIDIFHKSMPEAERIMMFVHQKGNAVVGKYPYDVAKTKVVQSMTRAKKEGFPFRLTMEED